jgi:hypothetical protein
MEPQLVAVREVRELAGAFAIMRRTSADAVVVLADAMLAAANRQITLLATEHRLPAMYDPTDDRQIRVRIVTAELTSTRANYRCNRSGWSAARSEFRFIWQGGVKRLANSTRVVEGLLSPR